MKGKKKKNVLQELKLIFYKLETKSSNMYTVFQPFLIHLFNSFIYSFVFAQVNIKTETGTVHLAR